MKILSIFALVAALISPSIGLAGDYSFHRQTTYAISAVRDDGQFKPHCSAVAIGPKRFLTAAHCILMDVNLMVSNNPGARQIPVRLIKADPRVDLALLEAIPDVKVEHAEVGGSMPKIDDDVVVVGNPLGVPDFVTLGMVQRIKGTNMILSAPIIFGNSGGPAFVKVGDKWVVVGIASRIFAGPQAPVTHMGVFTNQKAIEEFLKDIK